MGRSDYGEIVTARKESPVVARRTQRWEPLETWMFFGTEATLRPAEQVRRGHEQFLLTNLVRKPPHPCAEPVDSILVSMGDRLLASSELPHPSTEESGNGFEYN